MKKNSDPLIPAEEDVLEPFAQLIETLTDYEKEIVDPNTGQAMTIEQLQVDMPIELRVSVAEDDTVTLKGSAPTQRVATTVLPVFHRLKLRVVKEGGM